MIHPELERRWALLVARTWMFGAEVWIEAGERSYETQADLYRRWQAGTYNVPAVANPDRVVGASPWGWPVVGSYHMVQADGYSHALDIGWRGLPDAIMREVAWSCGLRQTVAGEKWHFQWWDTTGVFDVLKNPEEPMDLAQELAKAMGPTVTVENGVVMVELIDDSLTSHTRWPLGQAITFIHQELKMVRVQG